MKKAAILACFLALLCLLAGCKKDDAPTITPVPNPPEILVTVPKGSVSKSSFYYNWNYLQADGTEMGSACTPGMPEDWWNMTAQLETQAQTASISFALPADEIDVTRYSVTDGSSVSWDVTEDQSITLSEGRWTYQIMAQWTDESRDYHGWAQYNICIEKK